MLKLDSNLNRIYGYLIYPYYYAEGETLYNVRQRIGINIRVSKIIYLNIEIRLYTLTLFESYIGERALVHVCIFPLSWMCLNSTIATI